VGKIAFDKRPFTYRIHSWLKIPPLMDYFRNAIKVPLMDCLKTFNWGVGYYIFTPASQVDKILTLGKKAGYELTDIGVVEAGKRQTIFEPNNIILTPPGE
jgi:phosphoribosylaminoimidazole (AIR) synthetase